MKQHIEDNNPFFTFSTVKHMMHEAFQKVNSSLLKKLVEHVQREFEDKYCVDDGLQEEHIEVTGVHHSLGGDGDEESSSETSGNEFSSDEAFSD